MSPYGDILCKSFVKTSMEDSTVLPMVRTLEAALQTVQQATTNATANPVPAGRDELKPLLEKVKADISKVGLCCGDNTPSSQELQGLAESLVRSCLALTNLLHSFTGGAGASLLDVLHKAAAGVLQPAMQLLQAMAKPGTTPSVHSCVSLCWGAIDSCQHIPLDNKSSIFKNITTVLLAMKDVVREMTEMEQSTHGLGSSEGAEVHQEGPGSRGTGISDSAYANGNGSPAPTTTRQQQPPGSSGADEADSDDALDFEPGQLGSSEAHTLRCAMQLMEAAGKVLRSVSKPLLRGPAVLPDSGLEAWENVLWHSRMMQRCCEDLGAALYPPQDLEEVRGAADGMFNSASVLLQEIPEVCAEELRVEAEGLEVMLEAANQQLTAALQAAEAADV